MSARPLKLSLIPAKPAFPGGYSLSKPAPGAQTKLTPAQQDYARKQLANPTPNRAQDLRVLGFKGASELEASRSRLRQKAVRISSAGMAASNRLNTASVQPISAAKAKVYRSRQPSEADARAQAMANAALRALEPDIRASRAAAPGPAVSGYAALSALMGPSLAAKVPGTLTREGKRPKATAGGMALDVALMVPALRGPRAVVRGVKALRAGESLGGAAKAARASMRETGPLSQAIAGYRARTVKLGEQAVQFPKSPSWITARGQRMLDIASERLTPTVNALRESESPLGRAAGKLLTPASARGRVPKQAGKLVRQEARRRQAGLAEEVQTIRDLGKGSLPFAKGEGAQAAHFWWAQLSAEHRNAEGLALIRGKLADEHAFYTSGQAVKDVDTAINAARKQQREAAAAGDSEAMFKAVSEVERLNQVKADIPARIADLGSNLKKLDHLISNPPKLEQNALDSLDALMRDRGGILERAGKLKPERAEQRTGLVSRWLGLDTTGEEIYVGHRLGRKVRGARPSGLPAGVSTGRTKLPEGVAAPNRLQLVKTGRARQSLEAAIEDWQAAQVYDFHNVAKDELAKMGEPVYGRPKPGYVVINPKGHTLPRTWTVDEEARALQEGFDPEEVLVHDVEEYVRNYIAEGADADRLIAEAAKAGHLADLRQVPADVVRRYFGQFLTPKIRAATPGVAETAGRLGRGADLVNDALYTSLIYSNPGYIPANTVNNLLMAGAQQGAFLPVNLIRAGQLLARGPKRLRNLALAETGVTATQAAGSGRTVFKKVGNVVSGIADNPYRLSALIHEAARLGVIPKSSPILTKADYRALERFLTEPQFRAALNDVRDRAVQAMVDFERLGPMERALTKRLLFVWGWIRGATRYPLRFAADHPLRSALLAYVAAGAPGAPGTVQKPIQEHLPNFQEGMPPWLEQAIRMGDVTIEGKTYPRVLPTRATSPLSTPLETIGTFISKPGAATFGEMLNPGLRAGWAVLNRQSPYGRELPSYAEAAKQAGERLVPNLGLAEDLLNPPEPGKAGLYPEDASRLGRLKRASRILPIAVDPEEAYKARLREGMVSPSEKIEHAVNAFAADSRTAGFGDPPAQVLDDLRWKLGVESQIKKQGQSWQERAAIVADAYDRRYGSDFAEVVTGLDEVSAKKVYEQLRDALAPSYRSWASAVAKVQDYEARVAAAEKALTPTREAPRHEGGQPVARAAGAPQAPTATRQGQGPSAAPAPQRAPQTAPEPTRSLQAVSEYDPYQAAALGGLQALAAGTYDPSAQLVAFQEAQQEAAALSAAETPKALSFSGDNGSRRVASVKVEGPVTDQARAAIVLAQQYLGTPFVWGGDNPGRGFDCSGLLQYVWAKQGVQIPRTTYDQWQAGTPVALSELRPGDAVFFRGSDPRGDLPGHVGLYIGDGQFIEAPGTGKVVRISGLDRRGDYVGARRYA